MEQVAEIFKYACVGCCGLGALFLILFALPASQLRHAVLKSMGIFLFGVTAALGIYIVSPLDALPDFIPLLGQVDDVGALFVAILTAISGLVAFLSAGKNTVTLENETPPQQFKQLPPGN